MKDIPLQGVKVNKFNRACLYLTIIFLALTAIHTGCTGLDKFATSVSSATSQPSGKPTTAQAIVQGVDTAANAASAVGIPYATIVPDVVALVSLLVNGYLAVRGQQKSGTIDMLNAGLTTISQAVPITQDVVNQLHPQVAAIVTANKPATK